MVKKPKVSIKELLGFAIRAEIDSKQVYSNLALKYVNPLLKEKFEWLAYEEEKHRSLLVKMYEACFPKEELSLPEGPIKEIFPEVEIKPSSTLVDLLYQAMEAERKAEDFYSRLGKKFKNPHRKILKYLSQIEHSHYLMLKGEYSLAQEYEDYGEKEIDKVVT